MKKNTTHRSQKIESQLIKDLSQLISKELKHVALGLVTIQAVKISPDYAHAKIYVSIFGEVDQQKQSLAKLNQQQNHLRALLYKLWRIHTIPQLHFYIDDTQDKAFAMDHLIHQAMQISKKSEANHQINDDQNNQNNNTNDKGN